MILQYGKIKNKSKPKFSMPVSLQITRDLTMAVEKLHIIDIMSLWYALKISDANKYLESMNRNDNVEVAKASESDFDAL